MALSVAVVGPGRVGTALAHAWAHRGCRVAGFLGGAPDSVRRAIALCGAGRPLDYAALREVHVVALTTPDGVLADVVARAVAARAPRRPSLWLHTSGVHGLDVLAPLAPLGARLGSLHPLCPVPDIEAGVRDLLGRTALLVAEPDALSLLRRIAERAGLRTVCGSRAADRALYHAACALAANGLTAVAGAAVDLVTRSGACAADDARALVIALMRAALEAVAARGPGAALSGPVRRGEVDVVARHLAALATGAPDSIGAYRAVTELVVALAAATDGWPESRRAAFLSRLRRGSEP